MFYIVVLLRGYMLQWFKSIKKSFKKDKSFYIFVANFDKNIKLWMVQAKVILIKGFIYIYIKGGKYCAQSHPLLNIQRQMYCDFNDNTPSSCAFVCLLSKLLSDTQAHSYDYLQWEISKIVISFLTGIPPVHKPDDYYLR